VTEHNGPAIDLDAIRERMRGREAGAVWRSLDELADPAAAGEVAMREFPTGAWWPDSAAVSRREFLTVLGASVALAGAAGCSDRPAEEKIVPYVRQPEQVVPGKPLIFATAMPLGGYGHGVLVESHEGRPTKIEGNPDHPASLGGSDVFMQASVLTLYDPDRSQTVMRAGQASHWGAFASELTKRLDAKRGSGGQGLAILSGRVTSPTLGGQMRELRKRFPQATWHQYDAVGESNAAAGAKAAFGRAVNTVYRLEGARVIVSLDSDFLIDSPMSLRYARHFANARRVRRERAEMSRLYVVESTLTITGSMADDRLAMRPSQIEAVARALAVRVGVSAAGVAAVSGDVEKFVAAVAGDLQANKGACVVIAGETQPPAVHALAHAMNRALGNVGKTVAYTEPVGVEPVEPNESLRALVADMEGGRVDTLLILGGNPVYAAPADVAFRAALEKLTTAKGADGTLANFTARLGLYDDETSFYCQWHVPEAHYLEAWGDVRAADGTASIVQPLIAPLYAGKSVHEVMGVLLGRGESGYEMVRAYWRNARRDQGQGDPAAFERWWVDVLKKGVVDGTAAKEASVGEVKGEAMKGATTQPSSRPAGGLEVVFRPDPCVGDGEFANNPWLQELPKPFTKMVWDNAALVSPATAQWLGVNEGDVVRLSRGGKSAEAGVMILPGLPDDALTIHLGYGRTRAGRVGTTGDGKWARRGFNAYVLRDSNSPGFVGGVDVAKTGASWRLVATRNHHAMASLKGLEHGSPVRRESLRPDVLVTPQTPEEDVEVRNRRLVRVVTLPQFRANPDVVREMAGGGEKKPLLSLYPTEWDYSKGPQWGMSIDLQTCIGCNACVVACQAENNIPTVGKEEVSRMREMHWLRIDTYFAGAVDRPQTYHQPVPCMHCENAPCEYVCPTGATTHSTQGLNEMTYNRCIGTRYCSNNCPYKVRRFNFFDFGYRSSEGTMTLQKNPDVTVRTRGVMEKCTYCVQRINRTRIEVEKVVVDLSERARTATDAAERDRLTDEAKRRRFEMFEGLQTACQQACPTGAIVFGDINERRSQVAALKAQPHDYTLLRELTTRPRTSYLARVTNPNPAVAPQQGGEA
jgi:molybdopterin-containing oxidoreductase family iron-sulfur binding subunit